MQTKAGPVVCHRKPVKVQAWQVPEFDVAEWAGIAEWCDGTVVPSREHPYKTPAFILVGRYQRVPAFAGDWVIKDSANEFYPVPALLFSQSYDIVPAIGEQRHQASMNALKEV
jgi:hypothetical protein